MVRDGDGAATGEKAGVYRAALLLRLLELEVERRGKGEKKVERGVRGDVARLGSPERAR